jgi:uncharacterized membrane protein
MTRYELLLFLHITAAIIWLGAGFLLAVLILGAERARDPVKEASYQQDVGWLSTRLFIPASLSTLIFGLLLVADGSWSFDQLWVSLGLAGWLASFGMGILYFKPEAERIAQLSERNGPTDPEVTRRIRRLNIADRFQLVILFLVVADMVIKPTGDDTGVLIVGALILAAAGWAALGGSRAAPR